GEENADDQQRTSAAGDDVGDLTRLPRVAEPRAEPGVHRPELLVARGSEEPAARRAGDQLQRLGARRHANRLDVPSGQAVLDRPARCAERDRVDGHVPPGLTLRTPRRTRTTPITR